MTVPEDTACVDFSNGQEEAERQIKQICTRLLTGWADLETSDMQVSRISGGISNLLVKVDPPAPLPAVAVKVFGDKTELLIDRDAEKRLLIKLNAAGFGAPVVGLFNNGRIEKFLTAKTLTPEEMSDPRFVPHIARRLRAFHDLRINAAAVVADCHPTTSSTAPNLNIPGSQFSSMGPSDGCSGLVSEPPSQWDAIFSWLAMAEGLSFAHDPAKQAAYDKVNFRTMRTELKTLREMCSRVGSPRVLCHNDLLSGNILVVQPEGPAPNRQSTSDEVSVAAGSGAAFQSSGCDGLGAAGPVDKGVTAAGTTSAVQAVDEQVLAGGELQFIDFEYSCYGPRGFDWGNHFNEYAGFDCVYDRFPTPVQQKFFFRNYLKPGELEQLAKEHIPMQESRSETITLAALEEAVLERLVAEACVFALASHAYWGVWSFIQARYSPIDFDYLEYSQMRWAEYYRRKDEFFALVDRLFPPSH